MYIKKKVTWLILPVVICLSQRLSHASLSINHFLLMKLRTAHSISYSLFDGIGTCPNYMDNCSNLELIHAKST